MTRLGAVTAPERFGPYWLLDRINVGGMAEVFRGKQVGVEGFERLIALKRILPSVSSDPDFIDMFVDEAKIAVLLQHANIAQTYDLGKVDDQYFIAMEYVSGVDLRTIWDRARKRKRLLPIAMSAHVAQRVCEGLDAAHRKLDDTGKELGLVHRDISPHNVLCSYEGEVKIIDFGIAKVANKVSRTQAGALKGKFGYMSPEQIRGINVDRRSDIFAVGIVLWELLVGRRLFVGNSDFAVLEKIRNADFEAPSKLNPRLDPGLEAIVMRALSADREARYAWASEMAADLSRYLFQDGQIFSRGDLARYMAQHFETEIHAERERLDGYRKLVLPVEAPRSRVPDRSTVVDERAAPRVTAAPARPPAPAVEVKPLPASMARAITETRREGTISEVSAPWIGQTKASSRPQGGLPTWAAMLIGGLLVVAVGALGALIYVLAARP
ncbi:MAG: serine/threonine protein kinase [Myxococcales bacterium]|nr:serine/threonine protein kinase [Myxococcales bacterium]